MWMMIDTIANLYKWFNISKGTLDLKSESLQRKTEDIPSFLSYISHYILYLHSDFPSFTFISYFCLFSCSVTIYTVKDEFERNKEYASFAVSEFLLVNEYWWFIVSQLNINPTFLFIYSVCGQNFRQKIQKNRKTNFKVCLKRIPFFTFSDTINTHRVSLDTIKFTPPSHSRYITIRKCLSPAWQEVS